MIGIGITTHNRPEVLKNSLEQMIRFAPPESLIIVVDDASDEPVPTAMMRAHKRVGVARCKNMCLQLLQDCDHIFLFDDDTYPIAPEWWKPYVESKEPHLMYQFRLPGKPARDMQILHEDEDIVAYSHTRGAMLYIKKEVLSKVGGMDPAYHPDGGFEHPDWTNRIFNAGLTTYRAMDVPNSDKLLYCLDQDNQVKSSLKINRRAKLENFKYYTANKESKSYKEFRHE